MTFVSWGVSSVFAKLAANRIGDRSIFWDMLAYAPVIAVYCLVAYKGVNLFHGDKVGVLLAGIAGLIGSFGAIGFYMLVSRGDASTMVPLTALYPALTVILGIFFLGESMTFYKAAGVLMSLGAIYLLNK
jgi:bacterial/archaeal transporter family protein